MAHLADGALRSLLAPREGPRMGGARSEHRLSEPGDEGALNLLLFVLVSGPLALVLATPLGVILGWSFWRILLAALIAQTASVTLSVLALAVMFWLRGGFRPDNDGW